MKYTIILVYQVKLSFSDCSLNVRKYLLAHLLHKPPLLSIGALKLPSSHHTVLISAIN